MNSSEENVKKIGSEFSRYLTMKELCLQQQEMLKKLSVEISVLKSEIAEKTDTNCYWRDRYLKLKFGINESLEKF